jgi:hypothetical protein
MSQLKETIYLNWAGAVDMNSWGKEVFKLTDLFTRDELRALADNPTEEHELVMSVCLRTGNTNGELYAAVRLQRVQREPIIAAGVKGPFR